MLSENCVRSIMISHNLEYRPLEEFNFNREKYMQWHIEQFQNKLRKDIHFLMAVNVMGIIGLITVFFACFVK